MRHIEQFEKQQGRQYRRHDDEKLSREDHSMRYRTTTNAYTKGVTEHSERKLDWSFIRKDFTEQWKMQQRLDTKSALANLDKKQHEKTIPTHTRLE